MQLALDIGNSRIKWGLRHQGRWHAVGAMQTADWPLLENILQEHSPLSGALATQVAGFSVATGIAGCCARYGVSLRWIDGTVSTPGMRNGYDNPQQLGADRWAALIGARTLAQTPVVVINAGTATTIDALDSSGNFLGGMILPGLSLMQQALHGGTATLSAFSGGIFAQFPRNTQDGIASGIIAATVGAAEQLANVLQLRENRDIRYVLSGGHYKEIQAHLPRPVTAVEFLVLEGLACLMGD